jgi:hypothetical protein
MRIELLQMAASTPDARNNEQDTLPYLDKSPM